MLFIMFAMAMTLAMIISTAVALHGELTNRSGRNRERMPLRYAELRVRQ